MPAVRLQIGASLDPGAARILDPLLAAVKRARVQIANEMKGMAGEVAAGYRDAPAYARKGFGGAADEAEKADKRIAVSAQRAAQERARAAEHVYQIKQRYLAQEEREAERSARKQAEASRSVLRGAAGTFAAGARGALGVGGQIARGAGVDIDVGSLIGKVTKAETTATTLANAAFMPGEKGAAGIRQDPRKIIAEARAVADETALATNTALEGLAAFVGKTGDLATGRAVMRDLAILSKATGTELNDMVSAAGDVSTALGETDNKGAKVAAVMQAIAGQGKLGAVEIKDLASKMAKLAAAAPQFEGDVGANIAVMGALAQEARQRGGASSAAEAATSVSNLLTIFKTPRQASAFQAAGIQTIDKPTGLIRNPQKIIEEALLKKGMDPLGFQKLFSNIRGARAVEGFANIYRREGGGEKGIEAVRAEFERLKKASMGQGEIAESFKRSMGTSESKVQQLNNQLERVAEEAAGKILPEFQKLAPDLVKLASGLSTLAAFIAQNPLKAAFIGMGASLTKELAAAGIKAALEKGITAGAGRGGMVLGAVALTAAAVTLITETMEQKAAAGEEAGAAEVDYNQKLMLTAAKELKEKGSLSQGRITELLQARAEMEQQTAAGETAKGRTRLGAASDLVFGDLTLKQMGKENEFAGRQGQIENQKMNIEAILAKAKVDHAAIGKAVAGAMTAGAPIKVQIVGGMPPGAGTTTGPAPIR